MKKKDKKTHNELCKQGKRWLEKTIGARLAISEMVCLNKFGEIPDVIGWKSGYSILIECKTSKSDFRADFKKTFRQIPEQGMGTFRIYLCPDNIIKPEDLPVGWGLLYYHPERKNLKRIVCFSGNILMPAGNMDYFKANFESEKNLLLSFISRKK